MGCNCGQHAITKYRLFQPGGAATGDYDSLDEARSANESAYAGRGVIRTVRLPKPTSAPTPAR